MLHDVFKATETAATIMSEAAPVLPLYIKRPVLNAAEIYAWLDSVAYSAGNRETDLHITLAYSTRAVDWTQFQPLHNAMTLVDDARRATTYGESNVITVTSAVLQSRFRALLATGVSYDFPQYNPHVTVGTALREAEWSRIPPYTGPIVLGPECFDLIRE